MLLGEVGRATKLKGLKGCRFRLGGGIIKSNVEMGGAQKNWAFGMCDECSFGTVTSFLHTQGLDKTDGFMAGGFYFTLLLVLSSVWWGSPYLPP